jgi:hypothetical protein
VNTGGSYAHNSIFVIFDFSRNANLRTSGNLFVKLDDPVVVAMNRSIRYPWPRIAHSHFHRHQPGLQERQARSRWGLDPAESGIPTLGEPESI